MRYIVDENFARLNRIYPNSKYVQIPKYNPETWKDREYDSAFDTKASVTKWSATKGLSYDDACVLIEEGYRIGWIVPKDYVVVDIDNKDSPRSQLVIERLLKKFEVEYSYNYTSKGIHLLFKDPTGNIKSNSRLKCGLNIQVDTRANETGYIILPTNDPHRSWGEWRDYVEDIPYFLKPLMKDDTPTFVDMGEGDGRNDALFKWRSRLETQGSKLSKQEIEKCIRIINENVFEIGLPNKELFKTVLRDKADKDNSSTEKKQNKYSKIADRILDSHNIVAYEDNFFIWNGTYYKQEPEMKIEQIIYNEIDRNIPKAGRKEIIEFIRVKCQHTYEELKGPWYTIACSNGVLNLITGELMTPNVSDYNTIGIPWKYDPDPPASPLIMEFMKQVTNGDLLKEKFLYQVSGYALLKSNIFAKCFIFQGSGGTGKSTFMNLVQTMVGSYNTSHVGLPDFDRDYYLSTIFNKLLNVDDDVVDGKSLQYSGRFKSIVAGERISTRPIYKSVIEFVPFCTCMFSCNKMPSILDNTSGLYRRLILIELNHKVEKPDPLFMSKVTSADMQYFLFKSVQGIKEAIETGQFCIDTSEEKLLSLFKRKQSSLAEWLGEQQITMGDIVGKRTMSLYSEYKDWCEMNGFNKRLTSLTFKDDICRMYNVEVDMIKDAKGNNLGIGFVKFGEFDPTYKPF